MKCPPASFRSLTFRSARVFNSLYAFVPLSLAFLRLPPSPPLRRMFRLAAQGRAEYRGYCERICGGDPFCIEDTLSLQLKRPGRHHTALSDEAVVALASMSMTLGSRRRLAVNGTVESIGRLLLRGRRDGEDAAHNRGGSGDGRGEDRRVLAIKTLVRGCSRYVQGLPDVGLTCPCSFRVHCTSQASITSS